MNTKRSRRSAGVSCGQAASLAIASLPDNGKRIVQMTPWREGDLDLAGELAGQ
jgi:hypothetical protein